MTHDVIIIGAGPAGASAAIEAAGHGLRTIVVEEQLAAGGQVYRAPSTARGPMKDDGTILRERLRASGAQCVFGRRVWLVERGFTVSALGPDGAESYSAPALIVATGAHERHVPVPGWTLPGVIGLAAATILLKSQGVLPGRRVVVAGAGPLLLLVAAEILRGGGEVVAVVDSNRRRDWLTDKRALLSRLDLAARGTGWLARLLRARVPVMSGHAIRRMEGRGVVGRVSVGPLSVAGPEQSFDCDAVCYGFGLQSSTEITRLLGARHHHQQDGWIPITTTSQMTSISGLYACGDGAGVQGAAAAPLRGQIAALSVAHDLGRVPSMQAEARLAELQAQLQRASRFGAAMAALASPPQGLVAAMPDETIVCRCERLSRAELDVAIMQGAVTINDLKSATRCGMGPCGGRMCEYAAGQLIADRTGRTPEQIGPSTARPPLRLVPLQALAGDFNYDSLPMIEPAPL